MMMMMMFWRWRQNTAVRPSATFFSLKLQHAKDVTSFWRMTARARYRYMKCNTMCPKNASLFIFELLSQKLADFNNFWFTESWGNLRLVGYKFAHFAWKVSLHFYLVKFRTIIVISLLQKYDKKMFEWRSKGVKQKLVPYGDWRSTSNIAPTYLQSTRAWHLP